MNLKRALYTILLCGNLGIVNATVCNEVPGGVTCGKGIADNLYGNGIVNVHGTTVTGPTSVNGLLDAEDVNFASLDVNGNVKLIHCTINKISNIKGTLNATSTQFEDSLEIYSNSTKFINSKVSSNLYVRRIDTQKQSVYLDNFSEISGDIIFAGGHGEVIIRGNSKIGGKVVGGKILFK